MKLSLLPELHSLSNEMGIMLLGIELDANGTKAAAKGRSTNPKSQMKLLIQYTLITSLVKHQIAYFKTPTLPGNAVISLGPSSLFLVIGS